MSLLAPHLDVALILYICIYQWGTQDVWGAGANRIKKAAAVCGGDDFYKLVEFKMFYYVILTTATLLK